MATMASIYTPYLKAECSFDNALLQSSAPNKFVVGQFGMDLDRPLPVFIKTGLQGCGHPDALKYFYGLRFYGSGYAWVRGMVDGTFITSTPDANPVVLTEDPFKSRTFSLPSGTAGFTVDFEVSVMGRLVFMDILWDPVSEEQ